jgi:hypothetical protein
MLSPLLNSLSLNRSVPIFVFFCSLSFLCALVRGSFLDVVLLFLFGIFFVFSLCSCSGFLS